MSDDIRERFAYVAIQPVPHAHLCRDARREIDRLRSRNQQLKKALTKARHYVAFHIATDHDAEELVDEIASLSPANPSNSSRNGIPDAVRSLPDKWRSEINRPCQKGDCAHELERALSAEPEQGEHAEDDRPPHAKGEPTVRESFHGGYVWTYCDECGPDVKVDEDGLCIACGRDAVYFGKKHPDDSAPTPDGGEGALEAAEALAERGFLMKKYQRDECVEIIRRALREPRVPDGETIETIRDAIVLLEQSAGPFDEARRILRAADPGEASEREDEDNG